MPMGRIWVTMPENEIELFERKCAESGMTKSAFIRLLLAEHDNNVPSPIKYKEVITELSDINTTMKEILISENFNTDIKILLDEKIKNLTKVVRKKL